jgi:hypothetical protein
MNAPPFLPCPCGSSNTPRPVIERGMRKLKTTRVRCRDCGLTSRPARLGRESVAWNDAVEHELLRRREEAGVPS